PQLAEREIEKGVPRLVASATGTILELGPGSGNQVSRYDRSKITKIYGIEPTFSLHPQLRENIKKAGLSDIYTIVPCGIEDVNTLRQHGVDQEAFDTVLSVQCLCSVPSPKETAAALWRLLKPGGTMIVYEHVKSRDFLSSKVQDLYNIVWPYVLRGCCLNRDTARTVREAGEWAKIDIHLSAAEDAWLYPNHINLLTSNMHPAPRTVYDQDVDFSVLALQDPDFKTHLKSNGQLDFSDPAAVKQLTISLLKRDFGIRIELPDDRLCPPLPNRFNYILWIQDLLDTTSTSYDDRYYPAREVVGLDMFVSPSPQFDTDTILVNAQYAFEPDNNSLSEAQERVAYTLYSDVHNERNGDSPLQTTDIDDKNLSYARQNILANNLKSRIRPFLTKPNDPLIPLDALCLENITFTICNPPFYSSSADLLSSALSKSRPPHSTCTGSPIEMVTPGGEIAFVTRMITESQRLRERCQWYTTMLGKYSSLDVVIEELKKTGVGNWAVKEFVQGGKTRRWGVGWSWGMRRPREFKFEVPTTSIDLVGSRISALFEGLDLQWRYRAQISTGVGFAKVNVWSRAARRQQKRDAADGGDMTEKSDDDDDDDEDEEVEKTALGFKIYLAREKE
ncbi:MAG: hypothetical protein Q9226_008425, partial [Calogaya cf. arnoldii]